MFPIEVIDYTSNYVWYFEDLEDAKEALNDLQMKYPTHNIVLGYYTFSF